MTCRRCFREQAAHIGFVKVCEIELIFLLLIASTNTLITWEITEDNVKS